MLFAYTNMLAAKNAFFLLSAPRNQILWFRQNNSCRLSMNMHHFQACMSLRGMTTWKGKMCFPLPFLLLPAFSDAYCLPPPPPSSWASEVLPVTYSQPVTTDMEVWWRRGKTEDLKSNMYVAWFLPNLLPYSHLLKTCYSLGSPTTRSHLSPVLLVPYRLFPNAISSF